MCRSWRGELTIRSWELKGLKTVLMLKNFVCCCQNTIDALKLCEIILIGEDTVFNIISRLWKLEDNYYFQGNLLAVLLAVKGVRTNHNCRNTRKYFTKLLCKFLIYLEVFCRFSVSSRICNHLLCYPVISQILVQKLNAEKFDRCNNLHRFCCLKIDYKSGTISLGVTVVSWAPWSLISRLERVKCGSRTLIMKQLTWKAILRSLY